MPGNRVNVRLRVKPKPAPYTPPVYVDPIPNPTPTYSPSGASGGWAWWKIIVVVLCVIWGSEWFYYNVVNKNNVTPTPNDSPSQQAYNGVTQDPTLVVTPQPTLEAAFVPTPKITFGNGQVPAGGINLPANTIITGDVFVNGQKMYDDKANTGLIVILTQPANVSVDPRWGASYVEYPDYNAARDMANTFKSSMTQNGCSNGCSAGVYVLNWPQDSPQR